MRNFAHPNYDKAMIDIIINQTLSTLKSGGTILYPTDTIWGIGCDATNAQAIEKIYSIKQRDINKSMLILCSSLGQVKEYVDSIPDIVPSLLSENKHPTTIIYPKAYNLPNALTAADGSIGIRIPDMDFCIKLLQQFGKPIVSTSANFSGTPSPNCYSDIPQTLIDMVDYAVPNLPIFESKNSSSKILKIENNGNIITIR